MAYKNPRMNRHKATIRSKLKRKKIANSEKYWKYPNKYDWICNMWLKKVTKKKIRMIRIGDEDYLVIRKSEYKRLG